MIEGCKEDIWISVKDDTIFAKTKIDMFTIKNHEIKSILLTEFKDIEQYPINKEKLESCSNQNINMIAHKILSKKKIENLEKKYLYINLLHEEEIKIDKLKERVTYLNTNIAIILPSIDRAIALAGNSKEIIRELDNYTFKISKLNSDKILKFDVEAILDYTLMSNRHSDTLMVYSMENDNKSRIRPIYQINNLLGIKRQLELVDIKFDELQNYHQPIAKIKDFIRNSECFIEKYGYLNLKQIPFKIVQVDLNISGNKINRYYVDNHPLRALYVAFKLGLYELLNITQEESNYNWICCSNENELYAKGILPLLFERLQQIDSNSIKTRKIELNAEVSSLVKGIIKIKPNIFLDENIYIMISQIVGTELYKCMFNEGNRELYYDYGNNLKDIIDAMIKKYYCLRVQNNIQDEKSTFVFYDDYDGLYINKNVTKDNKLKSEILDLLKNNKLLTYVEEWKHNSLLDGTATKCFRISLKDIELMEEVYEDISFE